MANVVRFALSTAKTLYVPGAGTFIDGILDVDANNLALLTKTRYLVQPYRAVELGVVDASTPKPTLPAVPGPPAPDPYPQYLTPAEAASSPELRAALGTVVKPEEFGATGNATTDDTAAVQAAMEAAQAAGGGAVFFTPGKRYRCDGQLVHPGGGLRLTSSAGSWQDFENGAQANDGPIIDLRYGGANAKLMCLQRGIIEIDHVTLADFGVSSTPFVLTTVTQPRIHDAYFQGNPTKSEGTCDQDVIILGGTSNAVQTPGDADSGFAGYGGYIRSNGFSHIRRAVWYRNYSNNIPFQDNSIDTSCGSNRPVDAPIVLDSEGADELLTRHTMGSSITGNTLELKSAYAHAVILRNNARRNIISGNGIWDITPGVFVSDVLCDEATGAIENYIIDNGYTNNGNISGANPLAGKNYLWTRFEEWSSALERKPAGWKAYLLGLDPYHYIDTDVPNSAARLSGWWGAMVRSGEFDTQFLLRSGHGDPNGVVKGYRGWVYMNVDGGAGTTMWVKESGDNNNIGWVAK